MIGGVALLLGISLLPSPSDEVREQVRRIVEREALQLTLEDPRPQPGPEPERRAERLAPPPGRAPEPRPAEAQPPAPPPPAATIEPRPAPEERSPSVWGDLLLVLLAVVALVLLVAFAAALLRGPPSAEAGAVAGPRASPAPPRTLPSAPLDEAEALASEGRFADAVHVLLLRALALLSRAEGHVLVPSETSREVLERLENLAPAARGALAHLVEAVERSRFGGRPLDAPAWEAARSAWSAGRAAAAGA